MMDIDCIVQSFNEPQLDRCLKSLREQTYPYYRIINVNGVIGTYNAFKRWVMMIQTEWFTATGGDLVYYKDALENLIKFKDAHPSDLCCNYCLTCWDPFMELKTGYLCLARTSAFQEATALDEIQDILVFDRNIARRMREKGYFVRKNMKVIAGTHFEDPDEFQVFHRFFILATKDGRWGYELNRNIMTRLYERDKKPLQLLAIEALDFGDEKGPYGRSIDNNYNLQMYEEFKKWQNLRTSTSLKQGS